MGKNNHLPARYTIILWWCYNVGDLSSCCTRGYCLWRKMEHWHKLITISVQIKTRARVGMIRFACVLFTEHNCLKITVLIMFSAPAMYSHLGFSFFYLFVCSLSGCCWKTVMLGQATPCMIYYAFSYRMVCTNNEQCNSIFCKINLIWFDLIWRSNHTLGSWHSLIHTPSPT